MSDSEPLYSVQRVARKSKSKRDAGYTVQIVGPDLVMEVTRLSAGVYSPADSEKAAAITAKLLNDYAKRRASSCCDNPDVTVNASFVEYGYQMDILVKGEPHSIGCRDFGGNHEIGVLAASFVQHAEQMIERFRKNVDKLPSI